MSIESDLLIRSGDHCELCNTAGPLEVHEVWPTSKNDATEHIHICLNCKTQIEDRSKMNPNHWRCLNESMWSEVPAVKVTVWRLLNRLKAQGWPQDLLDMIYMEDDILAWAKAGSDSEAAEELVIHVDSNGVALESGDTVVLIKDLNVKGAGFTAKRGTAVRRISLVMDNPEHIEGRVNDQRIVILTKFVKKSK